MATENIVTDGIKSKERVNEFGEVFTPAHIVKDMCDMVKDESYSLDKTFLEPSCGTGNFLVELLERKLSTAEKNFEASKDVSAYELDIVKAVSTLYGVDIQADNVVESQTRMRNIIKERYKEVVGEDIDKILLKSLNALMNYNIIHGNTLTGSTGDIDNETGSMLVFEWHFDGDKISGKGYQFSNLTAPGNTDEQYEIKILPTKYNKIHKAKTAERDISTEI